MMRDLRRLLRNDHRFALVVRARASAAEVALAEKVIDDSGVATRLEKLLNEARTNGAGRPRTLPVRTLFVALLVLAAQGQPLHLRRATELLWNLPPQVRLRLGVVDAAGRVVTERQVTYLFSLVRQSLDPSPHTTTDLTDDDLAARRALLQSVSDAILAATLPDSRTSGSYALDATTIPAWARGYRLRHNWRDPDAGWSVKDNGGSTNLDTEGGTRRPRGTKAIFGYDVHLLTWVRDDGDELAPPALTERIAAFGGGRTDIDHIADLITTTADAPAATQPVGGDILTDRWYTQQLAGRFAYPVRRAGMQLVMDQRGDQSGPRGTYQGAHAVDGRLYCPAMPEGLRELPKVDFRNAREVAGRERVEANRRPWQMLPLTAPDDDGFQRQQCPAQRGQVRCPLKPASMAASPGDTHTVFDPPEAPGKCCTQASITVPPTALKGLVQKHPWGSTAWRRSYNRRNVVEGAAGMLKSSGSVSRPTIVARHSPGHPVSNARSPHRGGEGFLVFASDGILAILSVQASDCVETSE